MHSGGTVRSRGRGERCTRARERRAGGGRRPVSCENPPSSSGGTPGPLRVMSNAKPLWKAPRGHPRGASCIDASARSLSARRKNPGTILTARRTAQKRMSYDTPLSFVCHQRQCWRSPAPRSLWRHDREPSIPMCLRLPQHAVHP